ncbi:MAG: redox-regulated ATPase YchF [Dehalococcoidia bacterium]|nr:redox-regulated ATPase YchF [Dehalococcoidia bacterium]
MGLGIGIIGLSGSGRTTIFNALTRNRAETGGFGAISAAHVGMTKVPDARLDSFTKLFNPKKTTPAEIQYLDIGASVKALATGGGTASQLLIQLAGVDALLNVVRAFDEPSIPHQSGSIDVKRDISEMNLEVIFSDLALIEKRFNRIASSIRGAKPDEKPRLLQEQELLHRLRDALEKDIPIREQQLSEEEEKIIVGYQFLSAKPLITLVNIGEADISRAKQQEADLNQQFARHNHRLVVLCGKLEMDISGLDQESIRDFLNEYGLEQTGLERVIQISYELLGLISFLTVGPDDVHAWPITKGITAQKAAGKIHSDIERGFIRAEVIGYQELLDCKTIAEAKKRGVLRLEGKTYIVQDGDVINFLFNV